MQAFSFVCQVRNINWEIIFAAVNFYKYLWRILVKVNVYFGL
jgi:hypothetical protein